nr:TonB-dependent siderophore receptor [uncultured Cupriavidus sp.]
MRQKKGLHFSHLGFPGAALLFQQTIAGGALAASPGSVETSQLPAVVVSAEKRGVRLDRLDGAATVVAEHDLEAQQARNSSELDRVLPGVYMSQGGSLLYPVIAVRGVTTQDFYSPTLTVYVDGIPQLPVFTYQALADVAQVELLKGPQGTLYGKSAQGGILNITSHKPDGTPLAYVSGGVASHDGYNARAAVNGKLANGLFGSVTALTQSQPGNLFNPATGSDNLGGSRSEAGAARLRLAPEGAPWEVNLALSGECTSAYQDVYVPFDALRQRTIVATPGTPDPKIRRCSNSESIGTTYRGTGWALSAIAAWQNLHFSRTFAFGPGVVNSPERWRQDVQEIRLATQGEQRQWDGVVGLYRQHTSLARESSYSPYPGATSSENSQDALAAYADGTWHVTRAIDIGAGVRVSHDKADTQVTQSGGSTATNQDSRTSVLGQLSAGYLLAHDWRVYARVAQGYKPGGFNLAPRGAMDTDAFSPERSVSYELGSRIHRGRLSATGALFDTETQDMQLYAGPMGMQTLRNAGRARAYGAEFDVRAQIDPRLNVSIGGYVNRSAFQNSGSSFDGFALSGNLVPNVPRYGLNFNMQGTLPTAIGTVTPGMAVRLTGPQFLDIANTLQQPSYTVVDLRIGWRPHKRLEIGAYALNVFDRIYRTQAFRAGPTTPLAAINMGRIVGLDMRWDIL